MATKTINTRIKNRVDSLANWQADGVSLLPGEIALVKVTTQTIDDNGQIVDVPAVLMKVGESDGNGGTKAFDELPWLSAIAADVYDWAKSASATNVPVTVGGTASTLGAYLTQVNTNTSDISANTQAIAKLNGNSSTAGSVAKAIVDAINALDSTTSGSGSFVTNVTQTNGKVTVTKGNLPSATSSAAGITKLGVSGGAAKHDDVFGTGAGTIATRLSTAEGDIGNLKDAVAGGVHFRGTVTAAPSASTTTVGGVTIAAGDVVIYSGKEYICTAVTDSGPSWEQLGDVTRIGNLETKINNLDVTATNAVATTHKFVSQVTQADGKVTVTYTQPQATDVYYDSDSSVKGKLDEIDAAIASKAASGHTHASYVNQNAFSIINVSKSGGGSSDVTVAADATADTVTFAGTNITITGDATNDKVTFAVADGSTSTKGLVKMSDAIDSNVSTTAATSKAVKLAYDKAASAEAGLATKAASDHTHAAYVNQNAFGRIGVGPEVVSANSAVSTVAFTGTNVTITPNTSTNTINFAVADGTTSTKGIVQMSDAINSAVSTTAATSKAVKTAYDLASAANAAASQLANNKADASHTHAAYVNQNAFSNIKVGSTTIGADSATDTFEIAAGTNVTLTGDTTNDKVTINVPSGSTSTVGAVKLEDSTSSTSTTTAATPNSVKAAYDRAGDALAEAAKKAASGHTHSAYVNQNAFSGIKVGSTTVAATTATDTVEFVGSNVTITPDATNGKVTFTVANSSTSAKGVVKLSDAVNSTSTTMAATANAVKKAYDLAISADAAAAAIEADYVRFNDEDNHMYVGTDGSTHYVIFDCGGANGWGA